MNCLNCNAKLSCGCQKRVASNGKSVCSTCLNSYEAALKKEKEELNKNLNNPPNS
jgi:hypothetical protein